MIPARDIAARWNLRAVRGGREWRGECPVCHYVNGLALTERNGRALAWCASCQDRDGIAGALRGLGGGSKATSPPRHDGEREARETRQKARALALWRGSVPCMGTPAEVYLTVRGLPQLACSQAIRFRPDAPHPAGGTLPALMALVVDAEGEPMALHRTFLRPDGRGKAAADPPRAGLAQWAGGAIRLHPAAPEIVVGEGIETSASAGLLMGLPAWAGISAGNLARSLVLPPEVRSVVIAADADGPGRDAANTAAARWLAEGRRVRIALPDRPGIDFNDLLKEQPQHG